MVWYGVGFAAEASCPGVRLLSGLSPALLKLVLTGVEGDEEGLVVKERVAVAVGSTYAAEGWRARDSRESRSPGVPGRRTRGWREGRRGAG